MVWNERYRSHFTLLTLATLSQHNRGSARGAEELDHLSQETELLWRSKHYESAIGRLQN